MTGVFPSSSESRPVRQFDDLKLAAENFRRAMIQSGATSHVKQSLYMDQLRALECALNPLNYREDAPPFADTIEACAKIAEPWAGYWLSDSSTDADRAVVAVRTEIAAKIRASSPTPQIAGVRAWPEPKVTNPDIADPTGVPYLDCLIHRLLDAQQGINLHANEGMSQSLSDASALLDEVETALRTAALSPQAQAGETKPGNVCCYCDAPLSCGSCGREQPDDAGHPAQAAPDYSAWLIEMPERFGPLYFHFEHDDDWTKNHDKACHFARKEDAEKVIEHYGWTRAAAVEHMWPALSLSAEMKAAVASARASAAAKRHTSALPSTQDRCPHSILRSLCSVCSVSSTEGK